MKRFLILVTTFLTITSLILVTLLFCFNSKHDNYISEQLDKDQMLSNYNRTPSIVLLGGSSVAFGFDSKLFSEMTNMPVINDGLHAGLGMKFILDNCTRYLIPGDILIIMIEYSNFANKSAYGESALAELFYQNIISYFPLLSMAQIMQILENTPQIISANVISSIRSNLGRGNVDPVYRASAFNAYGDCVSHYGLQSQNLPPLWHEGEYNSKFEDYLYNKLTEIKNKGIKVFLVAPPITKSAYNYNLDFINSVAHNMESIGYPFMINPEENAYADTLFYDTHYHLRDVGAHINTLKLSQFVIENMSIKQTQKE